MQTRYSSWFSLGALRAVDTDHAVQSFRFLDSHVAFSRSSDRWERLSVALDRGDVALSELHGGAQPRSWALDPAGISSRRWSATDLNSPEPFARERPTIVSHQTGGVEGNINPHEDTRGVIEGVTAGWTFQAGEEVEIARSREGICLSLPLPPLSHVYGLGEKTGTLDKRGKTWVMWNTDEPTHSPNTDPLYQSIPVAYLFTPQGTTTIFVDSTSAIYIDAGESDPTRFQIEVGEKNCDLYLRHDHSLPEAVEAYTGLTGRMPLPPEWALGFQQCRYSYFPDTRVVEVAQEFRRRKIPSDVMYLDIHYMDGYRVFTWEKKRFPDPRQLTTRLRELGFHLTTIVDPGVKTDSEYAVFTDGQRKDVFLREPTDGAYVGAVWPGDAAFPDFSNEATRRWWADWHHTLFDVGVDGIWNDMNEPADFTGSGVVRPSYTVPDRVIGANDGHPASMARLHNAFASGMNAATRKAFTTHRPDERGFVLTRAGYAGIQRYAAVWTGDNHSWWEHIALMIPMLTNIGLSGVAFTGGDVGGFQVNAGGELYARWVAAACLAPFFRAHSALDTIDHEPWSFGEEVTLVARRYIGLRYQLLPYLYTLFEEATRNGAPVMRPLVWEFPRDPRVLNRADSFMVGSSLLVAPVMVAGVQERAVYLPAGVWYDFWSGEVITSGDPAHPEAGGMTVAVDAPLDRLPIFVRGGSIIPFEGVRQHTAEPGDGVLRLLVAPDSEGSASGGVYADGGEGFGYQEGLYWRASVERTSRGVELSVDGGTGAGETRWTHVAAVDLSNGRLTAAAAVVEERLSGEMVTLPEDGARLVSS